MLQALKEFLKPFVRRNPKKVFSHIYRQRKWGDRETVSGAGSTLAYTEHIRKELPLLFTSLGIRSLVDAPCGDYHWMSKIPLGPISYTGADIVPALLEENAKKYTGVKFMVADITKDKLPAADLILCRDCFIHLQNRDINRAISNFKASGFKYLLATTYPVDKNIEILTGSFRPVNLEKPPFSLPPPKTKIKDYIDGFPARYLGLWLLDEVVLK